MVNSRRIKVLHVAPLPPPLGGMVTYIQGLLSSDVFKEIDFRVVRLNQLNKEKYTGIARSFVNLINLLKLTWEFTKLTFVWKPDIVHIQSNSGYGFFEKTWIAFLAKIFGRKTLIHVHGGNMREFYYHSSPLIKFLIRQSAIFNNRLMTGSPQMRETWSLIGIPDEKIIYVGNAVNLPENVIRGFSSNLTILFLTRVVKEKGIIELIDAFLILHKQFTSLKLRIVGADTQDTAYVKQYLREKDVLNLVDYIGTVTDTEKHQEYLNADIFAFPTYVEDQSYAVMEAMSYCLPCVASNVGGVPSLIKDGENGILIEPRNVQSLREGLESLLRDPHLRTRLGENARKTIEEGFTWEKRSKEIVELYKSLVSE